MVSGEDSDLDLVRAVAAGRGDALAELYDRHAPRLLALVTRILGSRDDAEEVVQEALIYAWNHAARYDSNRSSVSTWLVLIARSRAIDRLRSARVVERTHSGFLHEEGNLHTSPEGARNVFDQQRGRRVREELARLPAEQAEILRMSFFAGLSQSEIAAATGIPLGTVKTRTLLAMKKLRTALRAEIRDLL